MYIPSFIVCLKARKPKKYQQIPKNPNNYIMFRGINSINKCSYKWWDNVHCQMYHEIMRNNTMMKSLADLGMNIVRLGNMWNGWQPEGPNHINMTYANILEVRTSNICN